MDILSFWIIYNQTLNSVALYVSVTFGLRNSMLVMQVLKLTLNWQLSLCHILHFPCDGSRGGPSFNYKNERLFYSCFLCWYLQDSLAQAVADEMRKIYRKELGPKPVPLIVPGEVITEEDVSYMSWGLYYFTMNCPILLVEDLSLLLTACAFERVCWFLEKGLFVWILFTNIMANVLIH